VALAAKRFPRNARRDADEEDVALSAFHSFSDRAARLQFPNLLDCEDLWRLIAVITLRKVVHVVRRRSCLKRGGGLVVGELALPEVCEDEGLTRFLSRAPSPEIAVQMTEDLLRLIEALRDETLQAIARLKMEGHTGAEIAARMGISPRSIDRKLRLIRHIWEERAYADP
jgi:hypothetical protein